MRNQMMTTLLGITYILLYGIRKCQSASPCPNGSLYNSAFEMCYWSSPALQAYLKHVTTCAEHGGVVLTIPNTTVYQYVYNHIPWTQWFTSPHDVYLGMYDVFNSETFYHVIKQPANQTFLPWSNEAQPAPWGYTPDQDCGIIDGNGKFQDKPCTDTYKAVCSKTAILSAECPTSNLLFYNLTCYWPNTTSSKAEDQLQACLSEGGTLAVIRNQETLDQVNDKFNDWFGSKVNAYVGYNDFEEERTFRESYYVEKLTWTNWNPGEPTLATDERCVEMNTNGNWNDLLCTIPKQAVCQKKVPANMFTTEEHETTISTTTTPMFSTETDKSLQTTLLSTQTTSSSIGSTSDSLTTTDSSYQRSTDMTDSASLSTSIAVSNTTYSKNIKDICTWAATDCHVNFTWSHGIVNERIKFLRENLRIRRNSTKAYRRSKYSPYEDGPVTFSLGIVGITVIVSVLAVFIILDLTYKRKPK